MHLGLAVTDEITRAHWSLVGSCSLVVCTIVWSVTRDLGAVLATMAASLLAARLYLPRGLPSIFWRTSAIGLVMIAASWVWRHLPRNF